MIYDRTLGQQTNMWLWEKEKDKKIKRKKTKRYFGGHCEMKTSGAGGIDGELGCLSFSTG